MSLEQTSPLLQRAESRAGAKLRPVKVLVYLLSLALVAVLFARGADFYLTPLAERAHHPGYWEWKAGGTIGHTLGIVGSTMMVLMLGYTLRKRVAALRRLGSLSRWLDVHIYLGVFGPLLVVLHSTFKVHGLVAFSFWSMVLVALSGVLGRYLYLQIPRTRAGEEIALAELEQMDRRLSERLRDRFGLDPAELARLDGIVPTPAHTGLLRGVFRMLADRARLRAALREFARGCRHVPPKALAEFERVARQKALLRRRIVLWDRVHELFHYWHVFHKPFAVVMYVFMVVHVVVAAMTGYGWRGLP